MTDSYDGPPLTRRERKERERAAAAAAAASTAGPSVDAEQQAPVAPPAQEPVEAHVEPIDGGEASTDAAPVEAEPIDPAPDAAPVAPEQTPTAEPAGGEQVPPPPTFGASPTQQPTTSRSADAGAAMPATEAIDMSSIIGARGSTAPRRPQPGHDEPATPSADHVDDVFADALGQKPHEHIDEAPARGLGRLFGRRKADGADDATGVLDDGDPVDALARAAETDAPQPPAGGEGVSVPSPSRAVGEPLPHIDVQQLDTVDDAEVDRLEIDEVQVEDRRPVSSRWIAEATPAELEDRREALAAEDQESEETAAGPRRSGRAPVVVNVVEDTSEHHISDLRAADTASIASASSVGTGTSTITANALVLPASGAHEPVEMEGDGVIVTGSIDLPDGFASSGRSRGTIDAADLDSTVDDPGELRSPETQPVRASKAVSSYANARVQIAPQRRSSNALPIAIGVSGVAVALGVAAVAGMGIAFGWF